MNILASQHSRQDFHGFWKSTNKLNGSPGLPVSVNGVSDFKGIAETFREHFTVKSPLGPSRSEISAGCSGAKVCTRFTAKEVSHIIKSMSRGKSPGHDDLSIEHLKCGSLVVVGSSPTHSVYNVQPLCVWAIRTCQHR